MNSINTRKSKVSVGVPAFNSERFLRKRIDSILSQTFEDLELIISDNASTDSTPSICEEYVKKDKRVRFFQQKKNLGLMFNFEFVLKQARGEYFVWAGSDDIWNSNFLEKNVNILESNKTLVGSISEVRFFDLLNENITLDTEYHKSKNFVKYQHSRPAYGTYEKKVAIYLKLRQGTSIYAVYRTEKLQKSMLKFKEPESDLRVILGVLKYGDFHVLDEVLMYRNIGGVSSTKTSIEYMRKMNFSYFVMAFPYAPLTFWCAKNLGIKIFIKNIGYFIKLNYRGERRILLELARKVSILDKVLDNLIEFKRRRKNRVFEE